MTVSFPGPLHLRALPFPEVPSGWSRCFILLTPFEVVVDGRSFVVHAGFQTDGASVPEVFENVIENDDPRVFLAAVAHDYLYSIQGDVWGQGIAPSTREEADDILSAGMATLGAEFWKREAVYAGVRAGGAPHWISVPPTTTP